MKKINTQLKEIEQLIKDDEFYNKKISSVSNYWQLDHMLQVLENVPKAIEKSNPVDYQPKNSPVKWFVMTFKKIPRGKGRAPKTVLPNDDISSMELQERFKNAEKSLNTLSSINPDKFFGHPLFGDLKLKKAIKFLEIHTEHHLKIVRDMKR